MTHEAIYSEIYFDFLRRSAMRLINNQKGSPTTFILHYVFNKLRDIEKSCSRGTFEKMHANCDAMDKIAFHLEDLNDDGNWIPELADYETPEGLLIAKQTLQQLEDTIGKLELSVLLGNISLEDYCKITGLCKRTFYKRLSEAQQEPEGILGDPVLRVIYEDVAKAKRELRSPSGIGGKELPHVKVFDLVEMSFQPAPA